MCIWQADLSKQYTGLGGKTTSTKANGSTPIAKLPRVSLKSTVGCSENSVTMFFHVFVNPQVSSKKFLDVKPLSRRLKIVSLAQF